MNTDFSKQVIGICLALLPPWIFAFLGRVAYYANSNKLPTVADTFKEAVLVLFMGTVAGGLGQLLGLKDGPILWAFISTTSFFGPKLIFPLLNQFLERLGIKSPNLSENTLTPKQD